MSETTLQFKKQLPKNAVMAALSFATYSISAIWLTPYLVKNLGAAAYGLIPLAGLLTQYASVITSQISGAVNRFLTIEIQKPGGRPNVVFNSSLALYLILVAFQTPLFAIALYFADQIFSIPSALKADALLLLGCSAGCFLINMLGSVFGTSLYAKNRLDLGALMNLARLALRLAFIILAFFLFGPRLRYIGYIDLALQILFFCINFGFWRKLTPELSIRLKEIDWKLLPPIFHMSLWSLVNQLGSLLYLRTDIWIINRFISPVLAGQYAAVLVVANFIRQISGIANGQLGPVTMSYWAKGELNELRRLLVVAVKMFVFGLAIPTSLICAYGGVILHLWLGEEYSSLSPLLFVLTIHLCINTAVRPLFLLFTASNTVRLPALVTFCMGVLNVLVSYLLGVTAGLEAMGVALATAIVLTLKNAIFTPLYSSHILKLSCHTFITPLIISVPLMGLVFLLLRFSILGLFGIDGLISTILQPFLVSIIVGVIGWVSIFSSAERAAIIKMIKSRSMQTL